MVIAAWIIGYMRSRKRGVSLFSDFWTARLYYPKIKTIAFCNTV